MQKRLIKVMSYILAKNLQKDACSSPSIVDMPFEYIKPEPRVSKISSTLTNMKMALEKLCLSIILIIGFLSATTLAVERNAKLCKFFFNLIS